MGSADLLFYVGKAYVFAGVPLFLLAVLFRNHIFDHFDEEPPKMGAFVVVYVIPTIVLITGTFHEGIKGSEEANLAFAGLVILVDLALAASFFIKPAEKE